jgi:sulfate adenylyltransferase
MAYAGTPIEMCKQRDSKGMCARARRGGIIGFTGGDDPYEPPRQPVTTLNTVDHSPEENAKSIVEFLEKRGFLIPS